MIYEFNSKERLENIKELYQQIIEINNSLSEKRAKYRKVANILKIDYFILERSFKEFEHSLLISCYTFSEQLIKNYFYLLLNKGKHENLYLNNFLESKISNSKFSPNVTFQKIKKLFREDLNLEFDFMINIDKNLINKYDELVSSRNRYAHSGTYDFDFNNFEDVINMLEFLRTDFFIRINFPYEYEKIKRLFKEIYYIISCLKKAGINKTYLSIKVKELRKRICQLDKNIKKLNLNKIYLLNKEFDKINKLKDIDLRNKNNAILIINQQTFS